MKKTRRVKVYTLDEYILEEKEKRILEHIKDSFEKGNIKKFLDNIKKAERLIRRRERKITYRLIRAAKQAKVNVYGKPFDIFEKELMEKHVELYKILSIMAPGNVPDEKQFPSLMEKAMEIEKGLIKDVEALIVELNKTK